MSRSISAIAAARPLAGRQAGPGERVAAAIVALLRGGAASVDGAVAAAKVGAV